jgi:hypothetical protein
MLYRSSDHSWNNMYMLILNFTYPLRCLRLPPVEYHCLRPLGYWDRQNIKLYTILNNMCFNWAPRHEGVLGEWRYSFTHSLTSALDGGEWSASRPGRVTTRETAPGTHWIGGWVGPRAVLDAVVKGKIPSPPPRNRTLEPRSSCL